MNEISVTCDDSMEELVAEVVDQFMEKMRRGEQPNMEEFIQQHPRAAGVLRSILPALQVIQPASASRGDGPPTPDDGVSGTLGDYRIFHEIGRGGMGVVYEAEQISLRRRVALKVLPFAATMDKRQLQRFINEARAAASLEHPHIVPVYGVGCERGVHYYAMRFIDGHSLDTLLQCLREPAAPVANGPGSPQRETVRGQGSTLKSTKRGKEDFRRIAELALQAAEALEHAHQSGVVHRDVKPANLLLDEEGNLWITDFGLAQIQNDTRLTMTGDLVGTLRYMSPEQALAKRVIVDQRTDVYSLGATFYEVLTLRTVFDGKDRQELLRQIAFEEPVPPRRINKSIPVELETVILKALEKNPGDRYATAKEIADDLKRFLNDEPTRARRPTLWQRGRKWSRRHKSAVRAASIAAVVILVALTGMAGAWFGDRASRQGETERAVNATLRDADQLQNERKLPEALAKALQAQAILASGVSTPDLAQRVESRLADLKFVAELEEIRSQRGVVHIQEVVDFAHADRSYALAFRAFGIDVDALSTDKAATLIRKRSVAVELAAAMDDWSYVVQRVKPVDETRWKRLLTVALAADSDVIRNEVRQALGRLDGKALKALQLELPVKDLPPATLLVLARAFESTGNSDEALKLLLDGQRRYPTDFLISQAISRLFSLQTPPNYDEAIRFSTVATVLRPRSAAAHRALGADLAKKGRYDEAIASSREAIRLQPDFATPHIDLGFALVHKAQLDEAIAEFREAIRIKPDDSIAHNNLGAALTKKGRLDEAIAALREAIRLQPDYAGAYANLGRALEKGQVDDAIAAFREAIRLQPDDEEAHNFLGLLFARKGQFDEAIAAYQKAIRLKPDMADANSNLGVAFSKNGQFDEGIAACLEAVRLKPDFMPYHFNLGAAFARKGQLDKAIAAYQEAIRLEPNRAVAHCNLGIVFSMKGQPAKAITAYQEAIRIKPDYGEAWNNLAWLLATTPELKLRDLKAALAAAKKAVDLAPGNSNCWNSLGVAHYRNGDWKDAAKALNKSIELHKEGGRCTDLFPLAMADWQLGNKDQAKAWYNKGVQRMEGVEKLSIDREIEQFRAEAAELLGIQDASSKDKSSPKQKK